MQIDSNSLKQTDLHSMMLIHLRSPKRIGLSLRTQTGWHSMKQIDSNLLMLTDLRSLKRIDSNSLKRTDSNLQMQID